MLWDYRVETVGGTPQNMQGHLQRIGADGWELVSLTMNSGGGWGQIVALAVFKRPYQPPPYQPHG